MSQFALSQTRGSWEGQGGGDMPAPRTQFGGLNDNLDSVVDM